MYPKFINKIQSFFNVFGYKIVKVKNQQPIDLRGHGNNPLYLLYHGFKQPILINVSFEKGRGLPFFTFSSEGFNPFIIAAKTALGRTDSKKVIGSILKKYYELVQPSTAVSLLGIDPTEAPLLANEPSWAAILPWDEETISQWKENHQYSVKQENKEHRGKITIESGWAWCGPTSNEKATIETNRLFAILSSIQNKGYLRHDGTAGDISGVALINSTGEWRWQARTGQHRAAVLCALGYATLPVRINKIIKRDEVELWPNVISGVFTSEVALKIFDNIFKGHLPQITNDWVNYV